MGAIARFGQLGPAFGLALSPSYTKLCLAVYVLVAILFLEVCYLISLVVQARTAHAVDAPSVEERDTAAYSGSSLSRIVTACCVTGPPDEVVACVKCSSPLPSPWLVVRKPPSTGRSSNTTGTARRATALWDYSELLISAQGASKCPYTSLVVAVRTEAQRRAQRSVIRRTWGYHGNYANCSFGLVFFMGAAATNSIVRPIRAEFQLHKDIVVELKSRWEAQKTCTFVLATEWVPCFVPNASLTLVVSDDTFVDVKAILSALDWFSQSTGDLFGRVTLGLDTSPFPQLEGCAVFAKPGALRRLQPAFADEPLSCDAEEALVTGLLSRPEAAADSLPTQSAPLNCTRVANLVPVMDAQRKVPDHAESSDSPRVPDATEDEARTAKESPTHKTLETFPDSAVATETSELSPTSSDNKLTASPAHRDPAIGTTEPFQEQSRFPKNKGKQCRLRAPSMDRQGVPTDLNVLSPPSPERSSLSPKPKRKHIPGPSTRSGRARGSEAVPAAPSPSSDQAKQHRSKVSIGKPANLSKKGKFAHSQILPAETFDGTRTEHEHDINTSATIDKYKGTVSDTSSKSKMGTVAPRHISPASPSDATRTGSGTGTTATTHVDTDGKTNEKSEHKTDIVAGSTRAEHTTMDESRTTIARPPPMEAETLKREHHVIRSGVTTTTTPKTLRVEQTRPEHRVHSPDADPRSAVMYSTLKELASTDITIINNATLATTLKSESTVARTEGFQLSLTLQKLRCRVMSIMGIGALIVLLVATLVWLRGGSPTKMRTACDTAACVQLSRTFDGLLNYSTDPCTDMNAFVCSKISAYTTTGGRTSPSLVAHVIKQYELKIVDLFLDGQVTFRTSKIVHNFLRKCTDSKRTQQSVDRFIDFFKLVPVRWPFSNSTSTSPELHPLETVLTLSIRLGVDTWFRAYVSKARESVSGSSNASALFIEASAQPTQWLDFVRTLGDRRNVYYEELHRLFNASLPDESSRDRLLATEKDVLSILDAARTPGAAAGPAVTTVHKVAAAVPNSTVENWLKPLRKMSGDRTVGRTMLVSLEDVRILWKIDDLLSTYSTDALAEHLAWWLVQILTVIGWPQGYYVIAGSQEAAATGVKVECYSVAASRFGLPLASESAVHGFSPEARREVDAFLKDLRNFLVETFSKIDWLNAEAKDALSKRLSDLEVSVWPPDEVESDEALWQLYRPFCLSCERGDDNSTGVSPTVSASANTSTKRPTPTLMDYWLYTSQVLWNVPDAKFDVMQLRWQADALEAMRYEPLNNRLRVSHAALLSPFYHPGASELRHANFGGLGASFLAHLLLTFMPPDADVDGGLLPSQWTNTSDFKRRVESLKCSSELIGNLADVVALELSWKALKKAAASDLDKQRERRSPSPKFLSIRDASRETRLYTADQVFFLTYCLSRCADYRRLPGQLPTGPDCNAAVRNVRGFAAAFGCGAGSRMAPRGKCDVSNLF
ncbi:hypothetical protein HPB49_017090 [Dermacentor silvarum]|uniref:Uncharacterized protein n=1 Tax=Dermacentor silvarum TaxID=543639 RepID=A0ACB8CM28_DERSI|nr:hypothetical protein HPB49_017090 [Dermacentor silvarum]